MIEAVARDIALQDDLRAHVDACASCRATFEQEQSLHASIDASLRVTANAEVPASLLSRVRATLDEAVASPRRWMQPLIFATASAALVFAIFLFAWPHHPRPDNQPRQTPQLPVSETPATGARPHNAGPGTQIASSHVNNPPARSRSTLLRPAASSQPEVLVPAEEREAFAHFVATLGERREVARALVTPAAPTKDQPASLELLRINRLEVKPLEGTESEESDGAENMR